MANEFERAVVICFNRYFTEHRMKGFAYRLKQSHFNTQYVDIIVDSLNPDFYLAIECKSVKGNRLSFTSNFHKDKDNVHQIDNISGFLNYTGRHGFLAVEFRGGQKNEAYLMPWAKVLTFFFSQASIPIDEFRQCIPLERTHYGYHLGTFSPSPSD
ncbi:MAG TPA: Holliday junction resolvase [Methanocorpusculum sp.]|nr:Holliday junction resolvase [Methanocorpusculum sp.]HJK01720.1 Holliday junction resolvase [Methanocorpusculum sp.]